MSKPCQAAWYSCNLLKKINICCNFNATCIKTGDNALVVTNYYHNSFAISYNIDCENVVVLIETDISEVTQDTNKQSIDEYVSGQKNVITHTSEVCKGRTFGFIPFSIPCIQISDQATTLCCSLDPDDPDSDPDHSKNIITCSLYHLGHLLKMSSQSIHNFFRYQSFYISWIQKTHIMIQITSKIQSFHPFTLSDIS